jgi:hypothetical protein
MKHVLCGSALVISALITPSLAADVRSISRIAFGPGNTMFVADWKEAEVHAFALAAAERDNDNQFNVTDLDSLLARVVGNSEFQI